MAVQTLPIPEHPDHHLWRNGRLWWVAFTVHLPNWQKERVRLSLGTDDLEEARRRRDKVLLEYPQAAGCQLSLRLDPPRGRRYAAPLWRGGDAVLSA
jgi:hypothetical protein